MIANTESVAKLLNLVMDSVREQIDQIQQEIIMELHRLGKNHTETMPLLDRLAQKVVFLEAEKERLEQKLNESGVRDIEKHIESQQNKTEEQALRSITEELRPQRDEFSALRKSLQTNIDAIVEQVNFIKAYEYPEVVFKRHDHANETLWEELTTIKQRLGASVNISQFQKVLENLQEKEKLNEQSVSKKLKHITDRVLATEQIPIVEKFDDSSLKTLIESFSVRQTLDARTLREDFKEELKALKKKINEKETRISLFEDEFRSFVNRPQPNFADLDSVQRSITAAIQSLPVPKFDEAAIQQIIQDTMASIPKPKDANEWEFKFDKYRKGVLLYRRSDEAEWNEQDLVVHSSPPTGWMDGGVGGGGVFDILINGKIMSNNMFQIDFVTADPTIVALNSKQRVEVYLDKIKGSGANSPPSFLSITKWGVD